MKRSQAHYVVFARPCPAVRWNCLPSGADSGAAASARARRDGAVRAEWKDEVSESEHEESGSEEEEESEEESEDEEDEGEDEAGEEDGEGV